MTPDHSAQPAEGVEALCARIESLIPAIEHGRGTHVVWRDWLRKDPANEGVNPHCGNADFHEGMVKEYDERLAVLRESATMLRTLAAKGNNRTNKRVRAALAAMDQETE